MKLTDKYGVDLFRVDVEDDTIHVYIRDKWSVLREGTYSKEEFLEIIRFIKEMEEKL